MVSISSLNITVTVVVYSHLSLKLIRAFCGRGRGKVSPAPTEAADLFPLFHITHVGRELDSPFIWARADITTPGAIGCLSRAEQTESKRACG